MQMFHDLHRGELPIFSLNFEVITLLPKVQVANAIQQYRPICLLNVSFKIFTKVATLRINLIADKVISPTQTAFMRGRNILEGVVILHETVHELHRKKMNGIILMIDFEKAYGPPTRALARRRSYFPRPSRDGGSPSPSHTSAEPPWLSSSS